MHVRAAGIRRKHMKRMAPVLILAAGTLWGIMGIFVRELETYGFTSIQIASLRIMGAAVIFLAASLLWNKKGLRIRLRDIGWFLGMGIGSILLFTVCYFTTMSMASLSVAAILLYTAPVMVMLMSLLLFREKMNRKKLLALVMAFLGCVLVTGLGGSSQISAAAVGIGLLSAFGYGLYSILGTYVLRKYSPLTVTTYTFLCGGVGALFACGPADIASKFLAAPNRWSLSGLIIATAFVTAVLPYLFYTEGLAHVRASSASIMASVEPVVATVAGVLVFHERMTAASAAGVALVVGAIVLLNVKKRQEE
jgi:DME family drug/metabolite transporter